MKKIGLLVLLLTICYFPLFLHLTTLTLFPYDESRLAINAWEMLDSGNWIVTHFQGEPDLWNTKPPIMIWLQVLSMKIFGVGELGVRFPAALAGLVTVFFIGWYCWKVLKNWSLGIFSMLTLITTPGYITTHVTRTGDYDSLLILFLILFLFTCFRLPFSQGNKERGKLILLSALWLSLAVLTKSIAGLFFVPAVAIYFSWKKYWLPILQSPYFYGAIGLFGLLVGGYYGTREWMNPGYLQAVWQNELGGRYLEVVENHSAPFGFFLGNIWKKKFVPWLFFLPLAATLGWNKLGKIKDFLQFLLLTLFSFLFIISLSQSKLEWYDAPAYPLLAIFVAIGIEYLYNALCKFTTMHHSIRLLIFSVAIFGMPYKRIISSIYLPSHSASMNHYAGFIKEIPQYQSYYLTDLGYNAQIIFYARLYNEKGYDLKQQSFKQLDVGEKTMFCGANTRDSIDTLFLYEVLEEYKDCQMVKITHRLE